MTLHLLYNFKYQIIGSRLSALPILAFSQVLVVSTFVNTFKVFGFPFYPQVMITLPQPWQSY